jgi:hypothetical protein
MVTSVRFTWWAALAAGAAAFVLYHATLLPGFDFGDTASFQVMAGSPAISPRDSYPLYFALGRLFAWWQPGDPARALNLASAVEAALACALLVVVCVELSGSLLASLAAAAAFAGSYTFWSQAVIAEVYALHIALVLATMLLLLRWERQPTMGRLAAFFAVYAISFGNHLSMSLLLPVYAAFLFASAPGGWRGLVNARVIALASALAALGALQYTWNLRALRDAAQPPATVLAALQTFWFDVTKADWRDTMVLRVPAGMAAERISMYRFDLLQQFGWAFPIAALAGATYLLRRHPARGLLLAGAYLVNVLFALGYNVGDSHVFFLPSHLMIALTAAVGLGAFDRLFRARGAIAAVLLLVAAFRLYDVYPAVDRHEDVRPHDFLSTLTRDVDARSAVLLTDVNWQAQNGLTYFTKYVRADLAAARMPDVLLYAPALVRDNHAIGRDVVLDSRARRELDAAYGPFFTTVPDGAAPTTTLSDAVRDVPPGTPYALCVLKPTREFAIDEADVDRAVALLTGGGVSAVPRSDYVAIAGVTGARPLVLESAARPFRVSTTVAGAAVAIRMDSWLGFDTIRRMGFAHVIVNRRHTLIAERGVSFATFDTSGRATRTSYLWNIFAAQPRYRIARP